MIDVPRVFKLVDEKDGVDIPMGSRRETILKGVYVIVLDIVPPTGGEPEGLVRVEDLRDGSARIFKPAVIGARIVEARSNVLKFTKKPGEHR